jgi:predicted kinase
MSEPKAVVMCGIPGSGKTSHVQKLRANDKTIAIINGDNLRASLYGDPSCQGNWGEIWNLVEEAVEEASGLGQIVIVDGTHCRPEYRSETLTLLKSYGYSNVELIVLDVALGKALRQNQQRSRKVPEHVIRQMHSDLQRGLQGICNEGFSSVVFVD